MMIPRPELDLRQLRAFIAVAEDLHFGRAAARLGIAQPPLSQQIRRLEERVGCTLLERGTRRVALTEAGRLLLGNSKRIFEDLADTLRDVRMTGAGQAGRLVIGFPATASLTILPKVVEAYRRSHPGVELRLVEVPTTEQREGLHSGAIDVGFLREPAPDEIIDILPVLREEFVAVLPNQHPLVRTGGQIRVAQLIDQPFVLFPRDIGPEFHDRIIDLCSKAGFTPRIEQRAREWQTVVGLVSAGVGVSLAPASVAQIRVPGAAFMRLGKSAGYTQISVCWRKVDRRETLRNFIKIASKAAESRERGARDKDEVIRRPRSV